MPYSVVQVDAFADRPFAGNPAAVCVMDAPADAAWMQDVAMEMNLSETAFVTPQGDGWSLRWFTPEVEVDLCGHATLASAHVLWEDGHLPAGAAARFHTRSGLLTARRQGEWITMDFPSTPVEREAQAEGLGEALGVPLRYVGASRFDWLVEVETEQQVRELAPDLAALAEIPARGVIVTAAASTSGLDFVSRWFGPRVGVAEDPVTGSAHCVLAPYWAARLGRTELVGFQASRRGGMVRTALRGDRVDISGRAVSVMRGTLL